MTDILFGQSYYLRFDPKLYAAMQPYPPLGTLYAAAVMRERGYDVALFDAMLSEGTHEWEAALDQHKPRYAVIYEDNFNYLSKMSLLRMRDAALLMVQAAKARGCVCIVCGSDATDHPDVYLRAGADVVILGEGDATLAEVINGKPSPPNPLSLMARGSQSPLGENSPLLLNLHADPVESSDPPRPEGEGLGVRVDGIAGIATLAPDGTVQRTLARPVISDLDSLPFPAWDLVIGRSTRRSGANITAITA
jgi:anaerobic magnesium-protoporphyrin IX monomethyl ester cyclase